MCEQRYSEGGEGVKQISTGGAFQGLDLDLAFVIACSYDLGQVT